ncbi:MAG: Maf family protein, partial [Clostridia bacterium]|nr:Maf family protein [Clostridia bacterium]
AEEFKTHPEETVSGCDTIVCCGNEVLGKPKDREEAARTLRRLSGKTHFVITGVCVRNKYKKLIDFDKTEVKFNILSEEFIKIYVDGGSPLDKAGSYGIQDGGIVKEYFGSYTNVVGLPVNLVRKMLKEVRK